MQPKQPGLPTIPLGVKYAVAVLCASGVAATGYSVLRAPLAGWREEVQRRSELVGEKLGEAPALRREHASLEEQLADLLGRVEQVSHRIPDDPREGEFLSDMSRIGATHGVSIDSFSRGNTTDTPTHSLVNVSAKAVGSYAGLCSLVQGIAELPRLTEVVALEVTPGNSAEQHVFELTYALYYALEAPTNTMGGTSR